MMKYLSTLGQLKQDERGVTALEYGLIAAVIIVVCAVGFVTVGNDLNATLGKVAACIATPNAANC